MATKSKKSPAKAKKAAGGTAKSSKSSVTKKAAPKKAVVEHNFSIVYDTLSLPLEKQKRIQGLIAKMKKEDSK